MNDEKILSEADKLRITTLATSKLFAPGAPPVKFEFNMVLTVGLIGQLQLAFRHPANTGPTREMTEQFVRELIERIDPTKGDVYQFLMMGFDERNDAAQEKSVVCRNCQTSVALVQAIVAGFCPGCQESICPVCGCTDSAGCENRCSWLPSGICTTCADRLVSW
jgi:hypothetical protein